MYNTMMYQPPVVIQLPREQLRQHCLIKERKDNTMNYTKRDAAHNMHNIQNGGQQHYQHNGRPNGKKLNQAPPNGYNRNLRILTTGYSHNLSQSQEALLQPPPPPLQPISHDSHSDSSSEDLSSKGVKILTTGYSHNLPQSQEAMLQPPPLPLQPISHDSHSDSSSEDLASKGVKRLHELNGSHPQFVHSYTLNPPPPQTFEVRRGQNPLQNYQPNQKKRHHMNKFGTLQYVRRNKNPANGGNNYQQAPDRYLARSQLIEVRYTPKHLVTGSRWDQLSTAIWKKFISNQQTTENYINKMNLFKHLYTNIKIFLRYSLFVVGSTLNGFGTNTSDLDLCLVIRNQQLVNLRADAIQHLINTHELFSQLNYSGAEFQKLELIEAKVPLLKFHHSWGVDVDVNCNNPVGIRNTHLLHCYAKADWRVQPLVLVVKLWAQVHQINDAKNMTISSYSLALMVIHFLQCGTVPAVLPCLQMKYPEKFRDDQEIHDINMLETLSLPPTGNKQSLGELLLQFFHYYDNFKYTEHAISVRTGTVLSIENCRRFPSPKNEPRAWSFLCIEEPFEHTNTARAVYDQDKFEHIRKVFRLSYQNLKESHSLDSIFLMKMVT